MEARHHRLSRASVESRSPRAKQFLDNPQAVSQLAGGVSGEFGDAAILDWSSDGGAMQQARSSTMPQES